jgi:hypothetical protein
MANYHVSGNRKNKYKVVRAGNSRSSGTYRTQGDAERAAKDFSASSGGGEVRIHRPDGRIRDSDTVAPGNDPNPPKDRRH